MEVTEEGKEASTKCADEQIITGHQELRSPRDLEEMAEHGAEFSHQGAPSILTHQWPRAVFRSRGYSALFSLPHMQTKQVSCEILQIKQIAEKSLRKKKGVTDTCLGSYQCVLEMVPNKTRFAPNQLCHTQQIPVLSRYQILLKTLLPLGMRHL